MLGLNITLVCVSIYLSVILSIILYKIIDNKKKNIPQKIIKTPKISFDDCNKIIDQQINEIYTQKYLLQYKLKDIIVIPNIESDIHDLTVEIINSFSNDILEDFYYYYDNKYFVQHVTRRVQSILIMYTAENKPNTK